MAAIVAAPLPPGVTTARDRSTVPCPVDCNGAAAFAEATWSALKVSKVVVGFLAIGIAARDRMRVVVVVEKTKWPRYIAKVCSLGVSRLDRIGTTGLLSRLVVCGPLPAAGSSR